MKKNKLLLFIFGFLTFILFFKTDVFALVYTDYSTNYNITYNEFPQLDVISPVDDKTYNELFTSLNSIESPYYSLIILFDTGLQTIPTFTLYLYPKSLSTISYSIHGYANTSTFSQISLEFMNNLFLNNSFKGYYFATNNFDNTLYTNFLNCFQNNVCTGHNSNPTRIPRQIISYIQTSNPTGQSFNITYGGITNNNNVLFSSQTPIEIMNNITNNSSNFKYYYKSLIINGITYNVHDNLPTYHELFPLAIDNNDFDIDSELDNYNILSSFYFRIDKDYIYDFNFQYEFNPVTSLTLLINNPNYFDDFYNSLKTEIKYFGRIYDSTNNYYTYESIDCFLDHYYQKNNDTIISRGDFLFCGDDLSNYDYIYVYLRQYTDTTNTSPNVKYVNLNVSYALYHYGFENGYIYDFFYNLPSNFKMSFSSYTLDSAGVYSNVQHGAFAEYMSTTDNTSYIPLAQKDFPFNIAYGYNRFNYYVVYGDSSIYSGRRDVEVFISDKTIISFNNNDNNNSFYVYDENKNIINVNAKIEFDIDINYGESYDLSYYFNQINKYIDNLSLEIVNFGNLTQYLYNNLPQFLQLFIFITFVLFCVYFVYRLIKK